MSEVPLYVALAPQGESNTAKEITVLPQNCASPLLLSSLELRDTKDCES